MINKYLNVYFKKNNYLIRNLRSNNIVFFKIIKIEKKYIVLDGNLKFEIFLNKKFIKNYEIFRNFFIYNNFIMLYIKNIENKNSNNITISDNDLKGFIILNFFKNKLLY